jgi:ParB family chromosome partitioning protein
VPAGPWAAPRASPLTLRRDGNRLILVAGRRRLEAVKLLGWKTVRANLLDIDEMQALFIEIDENLQHAELTALVHAQHIIERKNIWESLYPETKHGGAPGKREGKGGKTPRGKDADSAPLPNGQAIRWSYSACRQRGRRGLEDRSRQDFA